MKKQIQSEESSIRQKRLIIFGLVCIAGAITLSGLFFSIYSFLNKISFKVLNVEVPGMIFGLIVIYFGVKSTFSVITLKKQLYSEEARFSWSNFRKNKTA